MNSVLSVLLLCFLLASCGEEKTAKTEEAVEAEKTIQERAEEGNADAQLQLGHLYEIGDGVPKDFPEAYMWMNLAATGGNKEHEELRDLLEKRMTGEQLIEGQKLTEEWLKREAKEKGE